MHVGATQLHGAHVQIGLKLCAQAGFDIGKADLTRQNVPSYGAWPQELALWGAAT